MQAAQQRSSPFEFLRDIRFIQAVGQIIFAFLVVGLLAALVTGVLNGMERQNITPTFSYLNARGGFDISESPDWYSSNASFLEAFVVGLSNTLRVIVVGLVLATLLGVFFGIFLLSSNFLLRTIARVYVEVLRSTPLLVQLYVWYFVVMFSLPPIQRGLAFPNEGVIFLALRWLAYPLAVLLIQGWTKRRFSTQTVIMGVAAAAFMIEGGVWLADQRAAWADVPGRADLNASAFWLYMSISALLLAAAWGFTSRVAELRPFRTTAVAVALGQWVGGLLLYFGLVPMIAARTELYPLAYANNRGFFFPQLVATNRFNEWMLFVVVGLVVAVFLWTSGRRQVEATGKPVPFVRNAILTVLGFMLLGWVLVQAEPAPSFIPVEQEGQTVTMTLDEARAADLLTPADEALYSRSPLLFVRPERRGLNFETGLRVTPEYMALLLGLVVYTSAFIAEIVRAGIQAVPYGQVEAARSIGLPYSRVLRLIVLPQALRVIIPPLGNQYLNLTKNSSLAIAVAFPDTFQVSTTIMNTSGQSVPHMLIVMLTYLGLSLTISLLSNGFNRRLRYTTN